MSNPELVLYCVLLFGIPITLGIGLYVGSRPAKKEPEEVIHIL